MFSLHTTDAIARVENKSLTRVIDISYCHYLKNKSDRALVLYNAWLWHLTNTQAQRLWWMPRCWCHAVCAHSLIDLMWHTFRILISRLYFLMLGIHHRCVFQSQAMYLRLQRRQPIAVCVFEVSVPYFVLFLRTLSIFLFNKCKCKFKHSPPSVNEMNNALHLQQDDGGGNHSRGLHCETRAPDRLRVSGTVKQTVKKKKKRIKKSSPHVTEHIQQQIFPPVGWTAVPLPLLFNLFHKMIRGLGSCVPHFGKSGTREWQTFLRPWYRRPSLQVRSTRLLLPLWAVMPLLCNKAALLCHEYQLDICIPLWVCFARRHLSG